MVIHYQQMINNSLRLIHILQVRDYMNPYFLAKRQTFDKNSSLQKIWSWLIQTLNGITCTNYVCVCVCACNYILPLHMTSWSSVHEHFVLRSTLSSVCVHVCVFELIAIFLSAPPCPPNSLLNSEQSSSCFSPLNQNHQLKTSTIRRWALFIQPFSSPSLTEPSTQEQSFTSWSVYARSCIS